VSDARSVERRALFRVGNRPSIQPALKDSDEIFVAGDVYYALPGHLPGVAAGTELITFSPAVEMEKVNAVLDRNRARLATPQP
jgi:hypothetical protein